MQYRVLVVDDEATIRKLLKSRLEREGYDVAVASNADEAQSHFTTGAEVTVLSLSWGSTNVSFSMPGLDTCSMFLQPRDGVRTAAMSIILARMRSTMSRSRNFHKI